METTSEPTYKILGGDGQHYGPVDRAQFHSWVQDGRANAQTQILRSDLSEWRAASAFPELNLAPAPAPAPSVPLANTRPEFTPATASDPELDQRIRSGASWFYWIAALTFITSACWFAQVNFSFALGLGVTRHIDYRLGYSPAVSLTLDVLICGVVALLGYFAIRRQNWAFIAGLTILALDTALSVQQEAWFSVAFHAWAIVSIFMAFRASRAARG